MRLRAKRDVTIAVGATLKSGAVSETVHGDRARFREEDVFQSGEQIVPSGVDVFIPTQAEEKTWTDTFELIPENPEELLKLRQSKGEEIREVAKATESNLDVFERDVLWVIRDRAERMAKVLGLNPTWKRAYEDLADAADHLDGMIVRCTLVEGPKSLFGCKIETDASIPEDVIGIRGGLIRNCNKETLNSVNIPK